MAKDALDRSDRLRSAGLLILFPGLVLVAYGVLFAIEPHKALLALKSSVNVLVNLAFPLSLVFVVMISMNLFVKREQIARFLGKGAGLRLLLLSALVGVISVGPNYVWFPFLREMRENGAGSSPIAVFLYNRAAVKPFLLPAMLSYFKWEYVVILTAFTLMASLAVGYLLSLLMGERKG